jgi:hypothetical protein
MRLTYAIRFRLSIVQRPCNGVADKEDVDPAIGEGRLYTLHVPRCWSLKAKFRFRQHSKK